MTYFATQAIGPWAYFVMLIGSVEFDSRHDPDDTFTRGTHYVIHGARQGMAESLQSH